MFSLLIVDLRKRGARSLLLLLGAVVVSAAFGLSVSAVVVTAGRERKQRGFSRPAAGAKGKGTCRSAFVG